MTENTLIKTATKDIEEIVDFGEACTRIEVCELLHEKPCRKDNEAYYSEAVHEMRLDLLIKTKEEQILELSEKIELLEINVKFLEDKYKKLNRIENKVKETEEKSHNNIEWPGQNDRFLQTLCGDGCSR